MPDKKNNNNKRFATEDYFLQRKYSKNKKKYDHNFDLLHLNFSKWVPNHNRGSAGTGSQHGTNS